MYCSIVHYSTLHYTTVYDKVFCCGIVKQTMVTSCCITSHHGISFEIVPNLTAGVLYEFLFCCTVLYHIRVDSVVVHRAILRYNTVHNVAVDFIVSCFFASRCLIFSYTVIDAFVLRYVTSYSVVLYSILSHDIMF